MKAYERLLNYVKVPTPSDERSGTHPSSACQRVLAEQLVKEMKKLGVSDVRIDENAMYMERFLQRRDMRAKQSWVLSPIWIPYRILRTML